MLEYIRATANVAKTDALLLPGHASTAAETALYAKVWVSAVAVNGKVALEFHYSLLFRQAHGS